MKETVRGMRKQRKITYSINRKDHEKPKEN